MTTNAPLLREIIEAFDKPCFITDLHAASILSNATAQALFGTDGLGAAFEPDTLRTFLQTIAKSTNVRFDKLVDQSGHAHRVAGKRLDREGHLMFWFEVSDGLDDMAGFTSEVKKREAETSKRLAVERSSKDLVAASGDMILIVDRSGKVLETSASFYRITGIPPSASKSQPVRRFVFLGLEDGVNGWALSSAPTAPIEGYVQASDSRIPIEVTLKHIVWNGADATLYSIRDLSETQRAESAIQRMRLLEDTQKKAETASLAKTRLIRAISHEMRTPLNGMFLSLDLLEDGVRHSQSDRRLLQTLKKSTERLIGQVDNILSFVQSGGAVENRDPAALNVREAIQTFYTENLARTRLCHLDSEMENTASTETVLVKESVLQSLFQSLYVEALSSPEGALITVTCDSAAQDQHVTYRLAITAPAFRSKVSDSRLAGKAYAGKGKGRHAQETIDLNLWISQNAILELGGTLTFEEAGDETARAIAEFSLPRAKEDRPPPKLEGGALSSDLSVMIVDDDPVNRKVLSLLLSKNGNTVWTADNGQEALDLALRHRPDSIIMDLNMPVMDGITAARRILKEDSLHETLIIGATAYVSDEIKQECLAAGMSDLVAKPLRKETLFDALARQITLA